MIRRFALVLLLILVSFSAAAGDIAMLENLGFSRDSRVFLFGQYGIDEESGAPYAEIHAVDVASNSFVPGGSFVYESPREMALSLGQDGRGALFTVLHEASDIINDYGIDHLANGRLIYILVDGDEPRSRVSFRDFNTSTRYDFSLIQDSRTRGDEVEAAFHIEVSVTTSSDAVRTLTIGLPNYYRPGVARYRIMQVLLSPDEQGAVVVVEKQTDDGSTRYMVETTSLN
jgi:predicted secreted protein